MSESTIDMISRTTRDTLTPTFLRATSRIPCEVETYTHSVFPPSARPAIPALPAAIASELSWILPRLFMGPGLPSPDSRAVMS